MERRVIPEAENRLVILYAMNCLGPVTDAQLLRFMVELDLMNYITLQLSTSDLNERGQIARRAHPGGELWELTEEGRYAVAHFERRIPQSRRERMDQAAEGYRPLFRQEQLATADAIGMPDGMASLRLRLQEMESSLMELVLHVPADQVPTTLAERWRRCAQTIYGVVIAALTEGYRPDAALTQIPERLLHQVSGEEWLLTLSDGAGKEAVTLILSLSGEHLARWCAARWPEACKGLRGMVLAKLREESGADVAGEEVSGKGE